MLNPEELQKLVLTQLEEMKAKDIKILNVKDLTDVTDTMIIASGGVDRQVKAIAGSIIEKCKHAGHPPHGVEGEREGEWVLIDLIDIVVHIMTPAIRDFYQIEKLWTDEHDSETSSSEK